MATRLEQFSEEQRQKAMQIRDAAMNGTLNLQQPSAPINPRTQAVQDYFANQRSMNDLKSTLPPALTQPGSDRYMNSTLGRSLAGSPSDIKTYQQATGINPTPIPPQPSQYEINKQKIADSAAKSPFANFVSPFSNLMNDLTYGNPVGGFVTRAVGTGGGMLLGTPSMAPGSTGNATADRVADITGIAGGVLGAGFNPSGGGNLITAPWKAANGLLATRGGNAVANMVGGGINKVLPRLSPTTATRVAETALRGAGTGALSNTAMGLIQGQNSNSDIARNAALGAGLGAGGDLIIAGAGAGIRSLMARAKGSGATLPDTLPNTPSPAQRLPEATPAQADITPVTSVRQSTTAPEIVPQQQPVPQVEPSTNISPTANPRTEAVRKFQASQQPSTAPDDFLMSRPGREVPKSTPEPAPVLNRVEQEAQQVVDAVQQSRVRDRVYDFLDSAEQAARERIAKRRGNLNSNPLPEWGDYAIIGAAKMGKGTIKFSDWTEEMVKEFGKGFEPSAERVYRLAKEELRRQERLATQEGQAARTFNTSGLGNAETFSNKIRRGNVKKQQTPFAKKWEKVRTQFVDDTAALEGLEKRVKGKVDSAENSLYKMARMFKGTPEKANLIVKDKLAPIINQVEKLGYSADDLGDYAVAVHARDVNAAGYKSGFTDAEINAMIQKFENTPLESARQQLVQLNRDLLNDLVDSGVVSKELSEVLNDRWKNYIPLFRAFEETAEGFGGRMSETLANVASPIKALKGSERNVDDPMINMVKNIFQSVNASERNRVADQLRRLSDIDTDANFIRRLDPDEKVGTKNVVNVRVNGENVKYEVEPEVYRAMLSLDKESSNMLINILSKPANVLRSGATLTPEFSLRNPMRDVLQAFVTSESGFTPMDFVVGLAQSIKKGDLYKGWLNDLGGYGNVLSMDRNVHKKALEAVLKEKPSKKFVNIVTGKSLINLLRAVTDTTEAATKVGEYRAALRKGASRQEAAYRSRDLMDFARAGSSVRQANKIIAFLNANIQGKSKLIRSIKENPAGTLTRMFVATTLPTLGIFAANRKFANETQQQTISDAPDWMKDTFWLIAIPGTDAVARIPKPFDIAPIFANLPERLMQKYVENDPEALDGFLRRTFSDAALPVQISGLLPFIEGMANYSFFREGAIIPQREQGMKFSDQYDPVRTTEVAKLLAGLMSTVTGEKGALKNFSSPRIMDNTIQGLTAGLGTYATSAIDSILKGVGAVDRPASPEKRIEQRPFAKAFLVDPLQSTKSTDKLYTRKDELSKEKASAKLNGTRFDKALELKKLENAADQMSKINKQIRTIEGNVNLTAKQKREQIEPLLSRRNEISRNAMQK
ncbi:LPD38 domain-containing protein [Paenibacillus xylanexedens]|uniref:LPD38 domain-containing protein n=1 Tax=Paenibacillus xylanexedens TaxID=528191 RepID=UPI0011A1BDAA|nr:LPD38 domain-containing protein [Paenibacillus xylanexedens]